MKRLHTWLASFALRRLGIRGVRGAPGGAGARIAGGRSIGAAAGAECEDHRRCAVRLDARSSAMPISRSSCANIRSGNAIGWPGCLPTKVICVTGRARPSPDRRSPATGHAGELVCGERVLRSAWRAPAALVRMGVCGCGQHHAADARDDPAWRQQILDWYSKSARGALPAVGRVTGQLSSASATCTASCGSGSRTPGSMLVSDDSREQGDPEPQPVLRQRRAQPRAEGQLRHDDAHRDVVEHEGVLQLELHGLSLRQRRRDASMTRAHRHCLRCGVGAARVRGARGRSKTHRCIRCTRSC